MTQNADTLVVALSFNESTRIVGASVVDNGDRSDFRWNASEDLKD